MSCCKKPVNERTSEKSPAVTADKPNGGYFFKVLAYLVFLIFSPFVFLYMLYTAFKLIVLGENLDLGALVTQIGGLMKNKDDDDETDDGGFVVLDMSDVEVVGGK